MTIKPATEAVLILCMHRSKVSKPVQRPKISTAVPIVQTTAFAVAQNKHILRVYSLEISTAVRKNSTSAPAMLAAFCISDFKELSPILN